MKPRNLPGQLMLPFIADLVPVKKDGPPCPSCGAPPVLFHRKKRSVVYRCSDQRCGLYFELLNTPNTSPRSYP